MGSKEEEEILSKMSMPTPVRNLHISMTNHEARSGMQTPPLHTPAAIPFRWEEEPGKPWPCVAALVIVPARSEDFSVKSLELPPGLLNPAKMPAPPSGPFLLEGPRHRASSFRMGGECYGYSFRHLQGEDSICKRKRRTMGTAWFGSWRGRRNPGMNTKKEIVGSRRYSSVERERERESDWGFEGQENGRAMMRRTSSFPILSHPKSHFMVKERAKQMHLSILSLSLH